MPHLVINVVKRAIMKPSILEKLQQLAERLEEVTHLLGSPEATADMDNYRKLTREHAEITPVVEAFQRYRQAQSDLAEAQEMLADPEMKDFATEEIETAQAQIEALDNELQTLLLPKDADDDKNIFIEVRAGTGGDEAALFAWLAERGVTPVGVDNLPGSVPLETAALPADCCLIFGSEGPGLTDAMVAGCEALVAITQTGSTRSMNAGAAAAMGRGKGLVQIDVHGVDAQIGDPHPADDGVVIGAVAIDEPAGGVNPDETQGLADLIRKMVQSGLTVCLIEHKMNMIMSLADKILVLSYGEKIAEGTPAEIRANPAVIDAYLGSEHADA